MGRMTRASGKLFVLVLSVLFLGACNELGLLGIIESIVFGSDAVFVSPAGSASNTGLTPDSPLPTISSGITVAQDNGRKEVRIAEGTYVETIVLVPGVSLLGGYNGNFSARDFEVYTSRISYTIQANMALIYADGGDIQSNVEIDGLVLELTGSGSLNESWIEGILCANGASPNITNNLIYINNSIADTYSGDRDFTYGILFQDTIHDFEIANNVIAVVRTNADIYGPCGIGAFRPLDGSNIIIQKNRVSVMGNYGACALDIQSGRGMVVKNNVLSAWGGGPDVSVGIQYNGTVCKVINNTIVAYNGSGYQYGIHNRSGSTGSAIDVINNIIGTTDMAGYGIYTDSADGTVNLDYNLIFRYVQAYGSTGASNISYGGYGTYDSSNLFATVFSSSYDTDFSDGDDSDYHLRDPGDTFAVDKGIDANTAEYGYVSDDIDSQSRPRGAAFDRGAYEK